MWRYNDKDGGIMRSVEAQINQQQDYLPGITLYEDEIDELTDIYRELKWENVEGRRLGRGFAEALFDNQIAENEAENLERRGLFFKALQIYQTRDDTVGGRNILTDVENGDILKVSSELLLAPKDNTDLAAFNATRSRWTKNTEQKTFSFDIARGEDLPSRTPLGVANLSVGMVASFFETKREILGEFWRYLFIEDIIPSFKKQNSKAHTLSVAKTAQGLDRVLRAYAKNVINKKAYDYAIGNGGGYFPSEEERKAEEDRIIQELASNKVTIFDIKENAYKDVEILLDMIVTGEQIDTNAIKQTLQFAMQLLATNPNILRDKVTRTSFFKMLELQGVSPVDLAMLDDMAEANPMPQAPLQPGGSAAAPGQMDMAMGKGNMLMQ
jgi:hypothetical protein